MLAVALDIWPEAAFRPNILPGNWLWLDAANPASLFQDSGFTTPAAAHGDPVGGWKDQSGNARHATGSGATRPALSTNALNGKNGIDFVNGSSHILTLANPATLTNLSVLAVIQFDNVAANKTIVGGSVNAASFGSNGSHQLRLVKQNIGSVMTQTSGGSTSAQFAGIAYESGGDPALSQYLLRRGGSSDKTANGAQTFAASTDSVGGRAGADFMDGRIFELIVYGRLLSLAEFAQVEAYLKAKWGL